MERHRGISQAAIDWISEAFGPGRQPATLRLCPAGATLFHPATDTTHTRATTGVPILLSQATEHPAGNQKGDPRLTSKADSLSPPSTPTPSLSRSHLHPAISSCHQPGACTTSVGGLVIHRWPVIPYASSTPAPLSLDVPQTKKKKKSIYLPGTKARSFLITSVSNMRLPLGMPWYIRPFVRFKRKDSASV